MSEVHVNKNESLESALKRFKRQCARAGVLAEVRKREGSRSEAEVLIFFSQSKSRPVCAGRLFRDAGLFDWTL